ncbi:MAG: hypothetical protein U0L05_02730 [Schaedlerella sp.]|nr:hypothetical protein [Schaedlerella sp.]
MDRKQPGLMTPFDEMTTPRQLRFIKLLLPFLPASNQQMIGILIKFLELQHTIQIFQHTSDSLHISQTKNSNPGTLSDLFENLLPYLSSEEIQAANSFRSVMSMMEMMQMLSPVDEALNGNDSFNPMNIILEMLSPEQQEMFQTYQTMFSDTASNSPCE